MTLRSSPSGQNNIRWLALFGATGLVTLVFLGMIQSFLVTLILAAIAAAMAAPLQGRMLTLTGGRKPFAATLTLVLLCLAVIAPLLTVIWLAAEQALGMEQQATALVLQLQAISPDDPLPEWVPFRDFVRERGADIAGKLGELAGAAGTFVATALGQIAEGTARFFLDLFIFVYALFVFLQLDRSVIAQVLSFTGLQSDMQVALSERVISISRATIKGTLVIGTIQGLLGGLGFWAAGIHGAAFWGVIMAVMSVIPAVGPVLIIFGGVVWLFTQGDITPAIVLAIWGVAVVGTIDNILRPILVGRDTELPDILILVATLGGLAMFGAAGLVLGPVLAGLFITLWEAVARVSGGEEQPPQPLPDRDSEPNDLLGADLAEDVDALRHRHARRRRDSGSSSEE